MTNKELILSITDRNKEKRINKILGLITKNYEIQVAKSTDVFPTSNDLINIVIPAKVQKNKLSIFAHHDVFPNSLGYNDNSTGVATLLKLQDSVPDNVELVFTDGEERGGQGCRYYLEHSCRPKEAINVDVVGLGEKIFYEQYGAVSTFPIPESFELFKHIPFSDSYILNNYRVPNILILTGKRKESLIHNIFEAQHCGRNDGKIDLISETIMDQVFDNIVHMVGGRYK